MNYCKCNWITRQTKKSTLFQPRKRFGKILGNFPPDTNYPLMKMTNLTSLHSLLTSTLSSEVRISISFVSQLIFQHIKPTNAVWMQLHNHKVHENASPHFQSYMNLVSPTTPWIFFSPSVHIRKSMQRVYEENFPQQFFFHVWVSRYLLSKTR